MKAVVWALGVMGLLAQQTAILSAFQAVPSLPAKPAAGREKRPVLLGEVKAPAILASRLAFRDNLNKLRLSAELKARWKAIRQPVTLVAVFGSWCGDSHRQLPSLLALDADPNPFIDVHYCGVSRNRTLTAAAWPNGCTPQPVLRVPTFYLFRLQPGGRQKLVGSVVETPPKRGQTMAEALVDLLESGVGPGFHSH